MKPSLRASIESIRQGNPAMCLMQGPTGATQGALLLAAENATAVGVNLLAKQGRGVVCVGVTEQTAHRLGLHPMVPGTSDTHGPHAICTVSVDAKHGITTGISAADRAHTLQLLASSSSVADDLVRPGHLFPYVVHTHGVLGRQKMAEAAVDMARLAGLAPVGGYCGILDTSGELAQETYLLELAEKAGIPVFKMDDLVGYRLLADCFVEQTASEQITTEHGTFMLTTYSDHLHCEEHVVLESLTKPSDHRTPTVYVHRACLKSDVFGATSCHCGNHLEAAQAEIQANGGLILYIGHRTPKGTESNAVATHVLSSKSLSAVHLFRPTGGLSEMLGAAGITVTVDDNVSADGCLSDPEREAIALQS